jgi:hypothetical protein
LIIVVGVCEFTLTLYFSAATLVITAALWAIIGLQKIKNIRP